MSQTRNFQSVIPDVPRTDKISDRDGNVTTPYQLFIQQTQQGIQNYLRNDGVLNPSITDQYMTDIENVYFPYIGQPYNLMLNFLDDLSGLIAFDIDTKKLRVFIITLSGTNVATAKWHNIDIDTTPIINNGPFVVEAPDAFLPNSYVLTGGTGISVTHSPGIITVSSTTGGFTWHDVTTATEVLAVNNGYIVNNAGGVTFTLPMTSALGDEFTIVGKSGIWEIVQLAGQSIQVGKVTSSVGLGGSLTADHESDCATFVCITADTKWSVKDGPQTLGFIIT